VEDEDMKILSEKKVLMLEIEYSNHRGHDERHEVFDWLDKTYGELKWKTRRSGPSEKNFTIGYMVVEVEV
jgi:hypothetical protein